MPVDDAYFQLQREQIDAARSFFVPDQIEVSELPLDSLVEARAAGWLPRIRKPDELYTLYKDLHEDLPRSLLQAAQHDLQVLALPAGLDEERFSQLAGVALLATTTFHGIDEFVAVPRRFGEVRQYLTDEHGLAKRRRRAHVANHHSLDALLPERALRVLEAGSPYRGDHPAFLSLVLKPEQKMPEMPAPFKASILNLDLPSSADGVAFHFGPALAPSATHFALMDQASTSSNGKEGCESEMRISRPPF